MPDYNASAECKVWSPKAPRTFQGLCSMIMSAETGNDTLDCEICVKPIYEPYVPPPPDPCEGGTSVWTWIGPAGRWDLWEDNCPPGCTPTPPTAPGTSMTSPDPPEYGNGGCEPSLEPL